MKQHLKSVLSLTVICAVLALLLAGTNFITAPIIAKTAKEAAQKALLVVMPGGEDFEAVDLSKFDLPESVKEAYSEKNGGHVVTVQSSGYSAGMLVMCGIDKDGKVTGATCLSSGETLGVEKTYGEKVVGAALDSVDALEGVSGATKTVNGYKAAVKTAIQTAILLSGGSVDMRDEAQILEDNLKAALPDGEVFNERFIPIALKTKGVSVVYEASSNKGFVFKIGESFYGVKSDGTVLIEGGDEALKQSLADDALALGKEIKTTEVDISKYELSSYITAVSKTDSSFIFSLEASGYGMVGDKWTASRKPIVISLSVTRDGEIICCQTTEQAESEGIGDACADISFYSQFNGKNSETYDDIDAISGATITTNGYKSAIRAALEAVEIMKGE